MWSDSQGCVTPKVVWYGPLQEAVLQSVQTLRLQSSPELEMTINMTAAWFLGQEHSWISPPAVFMSEGVFQEPSTTEKPVKCRYFLTPVLLQFGPALEPLARCVCWMGLWQGVWGIPRGSPNAPSDYSPCFTNQNCTFHSLCCQHLFIILQFSKEHQNYLDPDLFCMPPSPPTLTSGSWALLGSCSRHF